MFCSKLQVRLRCWALAALFIASGGYSSPGQWATQSITLNPGWNAVYLEVQPEASDSDAVFASLPVETVWKWNRRFSTVQFLQDPTQLVPGSPDWLMYVPAADPARATRNLFSIRGGQTYLVKLKSGSGPVTWTILGQPVIRPVDWLADSFNLVGFPLADGDTPTFQAFFAGSPALANQPAYRLSSSGQWERVSNPTSMMLRRGEAYWVFCHGASTYNGPLQLTLEQRDGVSFDRNLIEQTVRIRNATTSPQDVTVAELPSADPATNSFPALAGDVPLSYYRSDATNRLFGWLPLTNQLRSLRLPPGGEWVLRLSVDRTRMADAGANGPGALYQSLLQVSSDLGVRYILPVTSKGLQPDPLPPVGSSSAGLQAAPTEAGPDPRAGLWVGSAVINEVSQPANVSSADTPLPVASPLLFRLLVHVDDGSQARLLQQVTAMFKPGTLKPDPEDPSRKVVDQPGRSVLITDDALIPNFSGATLRDGQPVGRRISSAAFGFAQPIPLAATGPFGEGRFTCQVDLGYDDPVNPFKHAYHPDHDNLDEHFQDKLPAGTESFSVSRQVELEFTEQDPDNLTLAGWGDNQLGGNYRETIAGLHNKDIKVSGTFRLTRISTVGVLNDGLQ